jgi:nudix motif 8
MSSSRSPVVSLTSPFTQSSLKAIQAALAANLPRETEAYDSKERNAAVLIPFCNINNTPGVLLEVRGKLRMHSGEVRCDAVLSTWPIGIDIEVVSREEE